MALMILFLPVLELLIEFVAPLVVLLFLSIMMMMLMPLAQYLKLVDA